MARWWGSPPEEHAQVKLDHFPMVKIKQVFESTPLQQIYQRKPLKHVGWKTMIFWGIHTPTLCYRRVCLKIREPNATKIDHLRFKFTYFLKHSHGNHRWVLPWKLPFSPLKNDASKTSRSFSKNNPLDRGHSLFKKMGVCESFPLGGSFQLLRGLSHDIQESIA